MPSWLKAARLAVALAGAVSLPARAQTVPSEPIVLAGGRLTLGGDVAASFAPRDPGYFNYTDYEHSALRLLRIDVTAALKAGDHFSILGDVRSENVGRLRPYALYVRIRPWTDRAFDIQVGRVPPTFGAFARRTYASDNVLIGYPLAYQYLTSLRADAVPANADELLNMRGRGWLLSKYSFGSATPYHGVPMVSAFRWDTGVQVHAAARLIEATASLTAGTVSHPLLNANVGKQVAGRIVVRPATGLVLGASAARGPFVGAAAARAAVGDGHDGQFTQTAWSGDVEYSRDYYLVRFETIISDWRLPVVRAPLIDLPLRAVSTAVEGRYKLRPGLYAAARLDHLGFSQIAGTARRDTWDAPVTRVEAGGGYSLQRNVVLKLSIQHNARAGGRVRTLNLCEAQLLYWF
jgi:hypothetical protein